LPTLRLRADYLAIVTIAAAEIIRQIARSATFNEYLGGSDGITGKFGKDFFDLNPFKDGLNTPFLRYTANDLWVVVTGWALVIVVLFVMWLLVRSPWGRVLKAIREDEEAVRSSAAFLALSQVLFTLFLVNLYNQIITELRSPSLPTPF
jgi:branched-chain amino acid transport system permease protein